MNSAKGGVRMQPLPGPPLPLSQGHQCKIRDRATIVARHLFAERGDAYADSQVQELQLGFRAQDFGFRFWGDAYADSQLG